MATNAPIWVCLLATCGAFAQTQNTDLSFEVASVKPHVQISGKESGGSNQRGGPGTDDPGQITVDNRTLRTLIIEAYGLKGYQLIHPAWAGTERYDIVAKVAPGATKQQARMMMRNLLVERFQLKFHTERRDLPVYELTVGLGGPKMKPSETQAVKPGDTPAADHPIDFKKLKTGSDGFPEIPAGTKGIITTFMPGVAKLAARKQTVKQLVSMIEDREEDRPILDMTGLTGEYDFTLTWSPESMSAPAGSGAAPNSAMPAVEAAGPTLANALERQLGLKMTPKKVPTDMMIVDSANKRPVDN